MIITNNRVGLQELWKLSELSNRKNKDKFLAKSKYSIYIKALLQAIEILVNDGRTVVLPQRMGYIRLKKFIAKKKFPNWKMTNKLWEFDEEAKKKKKIVWLTNAHTSGYSVKMVWCNYTCQFKNKSMVVCKRTRGFQRRTASLLKKDSKLIDKIKT